MRLRCLLAAVPEQAKPLLQQPEANLQELVQPDPRDSLKVKDMILHVCKAGH